jgi:formylglycine-generating enzyme required for sulfatase activity
MRPVVRVVAPLFLLSALAAFGGRREPTDAERMAFEPDTSRDDAEDDDDVSDPGDDSDDSEDSEDTAPRRDDEAVSRSEGAPRVSPHNAKARSGCPTNMARVGDSCVDRYEAPNRRRGKPLVMQTSAEAETWCESRKKRLCDEDEWIAACEGSQRRQYPYGTSHEDGRCNDDKVWRQVDEPTLAKWPAAEAKEHTLALYQASPSGSKKGCKSENGVYDLTGNVEEWVVRTRGHTNDFHHILVGCYWAGCYGGGKPTCKSSNSAHGPGFRFYETGFRCCKDAAKRRGT